MNKSKYMGEKTTAKGILAKQLVILNRETDRLLGYSAQRDLTTVEANKLVQFVRATSMAISADRQAPEPDELEQLTDLELLALVEKLREEAKRKQLEQSREALQLPSPDSDQDN